MKCMYGMYVLSAQKLEVFLVENRNGAPSREGCVVTG